MSSPDDGRQTAPDGGFHPGQQPGYGQPGYGPPQYGELTDVLVVGQLRAIADREVNEDRENRDREQNLSSKRLRHCGRMVSAPHMN